MCDTEWTNCYYWHMITASNRRDHAVLSKAIDTGKPVPWRCAHEGPQLPRCNAIIGYHRRARDGDPLSGHGSDHPVAPASGGTAAEAQPAMNIKTTYRLRPLRQGARRHSRGGQVVPVTSTGPSNVLDDR